MGQKVNPISLRLQKTNRFYESSWYSNQNYNVLLSQDLTIRGYLNSVLKQIRYPQARFFLKYMHKKVSIYSFLHNPHRSRKERANLLSGSAKQRSLKVRSPVVNSKFRARMTATPKVMPSGKTLSTNLAQFNNEETKKQRFDGVNSVSSASSWLVKQSSRLRDRLSAVKKSFCYLKNLQNLNKQRINSLFYMLHGLSSKNKTSFVYSKEVSKITMSILEKQFYIRYFLASFFFRKNYYYVVAKQTKANRASLFGKTSLDALPVTSLIQDEAVNAATSRTLNYNDTSNSVSFVSEENQNKVVAAQKSLFQVSDNHSRTSIKSKKKSSDYGLLLSNESNEMQVSSHWKKSLVNRFLMFRLLEKEAGTLLSTKYSEKPINYGLKDINLEIYPKTKNRYALISRAFTTFYSNLANSGKNYLANPAIASIASGTKPAKLLQQPPLLLQRQKLLNTYSASKATNIRNKQVASGKSLSKACFSAATKQAQLKKLASTSLASDGLKKVSTFIIKDTPYRNHLESIILKRLNFSVEFFPFQAFSDSQSALFLANEIVFYLEQRVTFRRIKTRFFKEIAKKSWISGIRISCSGRLGGRSKKAQRSKTECVKLGQTSLHVFSSKMDFAYKSALTPFGLVGVKVWISYK